MSADFWMAVVYALLFLAALTFVLPHWKAERAAEGEAVAENVVIWWRRYRGYRKDVSAEYSRHDGTQRMITNPRRYYKRANDAPPALPAAVLNPWFSQMQEVASSISAPRHLARAA